MAGALQGVKILELTNLVTGSLAGQMLGDLGAEIIKVERPEGDPFRAWQGGKYSPMFMALNRNKRSVVADLQTEEGREIVFKLIDQADVLIENFRPGVMDRLGLSEAVLKERNPDMIYCAVSGFGNGGPYEHRPAFDSVAQSLSGLTGLFVDPDEPQIVGPTISDDMTGIMACYGIQAALFERERGGPARRVDVNMLDATAAFVGAMYVMRDQLKKPITRMTRVQGSQSYAVKCADGKGIALHLSSPNKFWEGAARAFGRDDLAEDEELSQRMNRVARYQEILDAFQAAAIEQPQDYWLQRLEDNDVPYAPIYRLEEVFEDPQVQYLDIFAEISHPEKGTQRLPRRPVWFDNSRDDQPVEPAPLLGEHTDEVLTELGYSEEAIEALRDKAIV
ncbi:MAG: CaiB/BaiF CoA-transferase family protein [Halieaceae bacterium]|nr:CaiB/BaiF CoA-transferase family protein [Halieaceae bacterium]